MGDDRAYHLVIRAFSGVFHALGLRFDMRGAEHIPAEGAAVLACNHLSYLDFSFVGLAGSKRGRLVRFMAKKSTFDNSVSGPLMRAMGHIPVDRESGAAAYRKATRSLARGELVGVFPEATISRSWTLKSFKLGAATLAVRENVPLVPVVLWAPQRTFTVDKHYSVRRGKTIMVMVGAPLRPSSTDEPAVVGAQLRASMAELLAAALRDYPDLPRNDDDRWWIPACDGGTAMTPEQASVREAEVTAQRAAAKAAKAAKAATAAAARKGRLRR